MRKKCREEKEEIAELMHSLTLCDIGMSGCTQSDLTDIT